MQAQCRGIKKVSPEDRTMIFRLAADAEKLRAARAAVKSEIFALISQGCDSAEPRPRALSLRLDEIEEELAGLDFKDICVKFDLKPNYIVTYAARYLNGQKIMGLRPNESEKAA